MWDCSRESAVTSKRERMASANGCTGDVRNNLAKLLREIQRMKLSVEPSIHGLSLGIPSAFLPIIHCALMQYSVPFANWLASHDYELYGKNDFRFAEGVYKVMRDVFYYHPRLSMNQFLDVGFAERKIIMTTDVLRFCQAKHRELTGKSPQRRTKRKLYPVTASDLSGGTGIHSSSKAHVGDYRAVSVCSEPAVVDGGATVVSTSSSPDLAPRSLSVSPIGGLGSSAHSSPCKDSAQHGMHPPLFLLRPADAAHVSADPPKGDLPTCEARRVEGLVIRHKDDDKVAKEIGLPTRREEGVVEGNSGASLAFFPEGLSREARGKAEDDVESVVSWQSLPLRDDLRNGSKQDGDMKRHPSSGCRADDGTEVCSKIDQLAQMIEKLSARFVIFETQMKLMESQRGGGKALSGQQQQVKPPNQPQDKENYQDKENKQPQDKENKQPQDKENKQPQDKENKQPQDKENRQPQDKENKQPLSIISSLPPPPSRDVPTSTSSTLRASDPSNVSISHNLCTNLRSQGVIPQKPAETLDMRTRGAPGTDLRERWRQTILGGQDSPVGTPVARPSWSSQERFTQGSLVFLPSPVQSPSTPEDTRKLIEGLRQRAKKTKEFLDKATL